MANKAIQTDRYRLSGTYERLRKTLLEHPQDDRNSKPLSYWVLPTDKRLPIAFLDRSLSDLLSQPLEELMATPGVGQKKILGFFDLLRRVAKANTADGPFIAPSPSASADADSTADYFAPESVSEAVWSNWCETVNRYGFREETLGRLAPSLQSLPTVIWQVRLEEYADLSLTEIRNLKTHGNKRVRAILEVFCTVHEAASIAVLPETIDLHLAPRFISPINRWLLTVARQQTPPSVSETHDHLIQPLVKQIELDLGATVARLVANRLTIAADAPTVKQHADELGVTRARVYQLFEDSARAMEVRWPEGRWLMPAILSKDADHQNANSLVQAAYELFFLPDRMPADTQQSEQHVRNNC